MIKIFFLLFYLFTSCASKDANLRWRELVNKKEFNTALQEIEKSPLKNEKKLYLLYLMERGRFLFLSGELAQASRVFYEASDFLDTFYTTKLTQELLASLGNDTSLEFSGFPYERSMLYYYLTLANLKLYYQQIADNASDANSYLFKARAAVVAWNGFFEQIKNSPLGVNLYQDDLFSKIFAAHVHEEVGTRNDLNIALQLYEKAIQILQILGPSFEIYNERYNDYSIELLSLVKKNVQPTQDSIKKLPLQSDLFSNKNNFYNQSMRFILERYLQLSLKLGSQNWQSIVKRQDVKEYFSDSELENIQQTFGQKNNGQLTLYFEEGLVAPVIAKEFDYSLNNAISQIKDKNTKAVVEQIGLPVLTLFAMGPLGLGFFSNSGNTYLFARHDAGSHVIRHIGINFEMPMVEYRPPQSRWVISIYQVLDQEKLFMMKSLTLASPVSDLALQGARERANNSYTKVGVRVALKHLTAILAAYASYKKLKESNGELIARAVAITQYMASTKLIKQTEKADTRYWSTLPAHIWTQNFSLSPGRYRIMLEEQNQNGEKVKGHDLGIQTITQNKKTFLYHFSPASVSI